MAIISVDTSSEEKNTKEIQPNQLNKSMSNIYDGARESVSDLSNMILYQSSDDGRRSLHNQSIDGNEGFIGRKQNFILDGELLTLRVIFIDIFVMLCALISDFVQVSSILIVDTSDQHESPNFLFASIAFIIIWIPGIPAAIHYLSVFRHRLVWYRSLLYALLIFLFYPIIPIIAKFILIWIRPSDNKLTKEYLEAQYGATVAYIIYGCISAPLQLFYQSWLVLNGIVSMNFGNREIVLPSAAANEVKIKWPSTLLCLISSILT